MSSSFLNFFNDEGYMLDNSNGNVTDKGNGGIGNPRVLREVNLENEALPDGFDARVRLEEIVLLQPKCSCNTGECAICRGGIA